MKIYFAAAVRGGRQDAALYHDNGRSLSAMLSGCSEVIVREYQQAAKLTDIFEEFSAGKVRIGKEH